MGILKVWVEDGCTVCNECEEAAPEIFFVTDTTSIVKGTAREDGVEGRNEDEQSLLKAELREEWEEGIREAAAVCPVEIIKFEEEE